MPNYKLRYFFDAGSGICLWSANDSAREKFGYPIDVSQLNLDENTKRKAYYLLAWYDTCINWNSPADPCSWSTEDRARFKC